MPSHVGLTSKRLIGTLWGSRGRRLRAVRGLWVLFLVLVPTPASGQADVPEAKLVIDAQAPIGSTKDIWVKATGAGRPKLPIYLVDESGLEDAIASSVPITSCSDETTRQTGVGDRTWCFRISGLTAGHTLTGTVESDGVRLSLTTRTKNPFFWGPLLTIVLSIIVWVALLWLTTLGGAKNATARLLIDLRIRKNKKAGGDSVSDLEDWTAGSRLDPSTVADALLIAIKGARSEAPRARQRLQERVAASKLPTSTRILVLAQEEASRRDHVMEDFVDEKGQAKAHPAAGHAAAVDEASRLWDRLLEARVGIGRVANATERRRLDGDADLAETSLRTKGASELDAIDQAVTLLQADVARQPTTQLLPTAPPSGTLVLAEAPRPARGQPRWAKLVVAAAVVLVAGVVALPLLTSNRSAVEPPPTPSPTPTQSGVTQTPPASTPPPSSPTPTPGPISGASSPWPRIVFWAVAAIVVLAAVGWFLRRRVSLGTLVGALTANGFVVVVSVGVAVAVGWKNWASTPTFGLGSDYVSLVLETIGSATLAALATVAVVLARRRFA